MPNASTIGSLTRLAIGTTTPATNLINVGDFDHGVAAEFVEADRNRGSLDYQANRTRLNRLMVVPSFTVEPTVEELALLLPWIFGQAPSGAAGALTYNLANTPAERDIQFDDSNGNCDTFQACAVRQAVFSVGESGALQLQLSCIGKTHVTNVAFPTLTNLDVTTPIFVLPDTTGAVTIAGSVRMVQSLSLTITRKIDDRFLNSLTHTKSMDADRNVEFTAVYPEGEYSALWASAETPAAASVKFTAGGYSLEWIMPSVRFPRAAKRVPVRAEMFHQLTGRCFETGPSNALVPPVRMVLDTTA